MINQNSYDYFKKTLSPDELSAVEQFVGNAKMVEAVRKVLMDRVIAQGVPPVQGEEYKLRNFVFGLDKTGEMNDDQFGRAVRVHIEALMVVEQQFDLLKKLGEPKKEDAKTANPAR